MGMLLRRNKSLYEKPSATPKGDEKPPAAPAVADKTKKKTEGKKDGLQNS